MIATRLNQYNLQYRFKYRCEKDMGVWTYIDIIRDNKIISIGKIRSNDTLPHISFSRQSMSSKNNPLNVNDIRKIYRNNELRNTICQSSLNLNDGYVEFI